MHSQSANPGRPPSGWKARAAPMMLAFASIRALRRGIRRINGLTSHRPTRFPNARQVLPRGERQLAGVHVDRKAQLRASSNAEPERSPCVCVTRIAAALVPAPNNRSAACLINWPRSGHEVSISTHDDSDRTK
jgi:hypothetical protein